MFRLIVQLASSVRAVLQYAPTNRFLRQLHSRRGVVSIVAAMLAGVAYLFAAAICTVLLDGGAPGWFNILVVLFLWNGAKLALNGLIMATVLVRSGLRSVRSRQARPPEQPWARPPSLGTCARPRPSATERMRRRPSDTDDAGPKVGSGVRCVRSDVFLRPFPPPHSARTSVRIARAGNSRVAEPKACGSIHVVPLAAELR